MKSTKTITFRCDTGLHAVLQEKTKIGEYRSRTLTDVVISLIEDGLITQRKRDLALERAVKGQLFKDDAKDADIWKIVKDNWRASIEDPIVNEMLTEALEALEAEHGREYVDMKLKDLGLR